jgi:hypothetical protein
VKSRTPDLDDSALAVFLVMELLDGQSLEHPPVVRVEM